MAFGSFEILAGDYKIGSNVGHQILGTDIWLQTSSSFFRKKISVADLASVERIDETSGRSVGAALGWGVAGAVVAGPLGAIAAGYLGSKKDSVTFSCVLKDGTAFVGRMTHKQFGPLEAPFLHAAKLREAKTAEGDIPGTSTEEEAPRRAPRAAGELPPMRHEPPVQAHPNETNARWLAPRDHTPEPVARAPGRVTFGKRRDPIG